MTVAIRGVQNFFDCKREKIRVLLQNPINISEHSILTAYYCSIKEAIIEGNKAHLNMHINYRLMTRQTYQTVGKKTLTPPPPLEEG
jgi:hypothetical protein